VEQVQRLEAEGVAVNGTRVDLRRYGYTFGGAREGGRGKARIRTSV
jgi:hypothetical protein